MASPAGLLFQEGRDVLGDGKSLRRTTDGRAPRARLSCLTMVHQQEAALTPAPFYQRGRRWPLVGGGMRPQPGWPRRGVARGWLGSTPLCPTTPVCSPKRPIPAGSVTKKKGTGVQRAPCAPFAQTAPCALLRARPLPNPPRASHPVQNPLCAQPRARCWCEPPPAPFSPPRAPFPRAQSRGCEPGCPPCALRPAPCATPPCQLPAGLSGDYLAASSAGTR